MKNNLSYEGIALAYRNAIMLEAGDEEGIPELMTGIMADIAQFGYTFSESLQERIGTLSVLEIEAFHEFLVSHLQQIVGADLKYEPLFVDFPNDIPELDVLNAAIETTLANKPIELGLISKKEMYGIFTNLVGAKTSISESDKEVLTFFVEIEKNKIEQHCPDSVFMKENASFLAGLLIEHTDVADKVLPNYINTATDVLRLATQLSGGDVSLTEPTKYKLSNGNRRLVMSLLNKASNIQEDMMRHRTKWIKLGEVLHPGQKKFSYKFKDASLAFKTLRNNPKSISTFSGKLEQEVLFAKGGYDTNKLSDMLMLRPGEFARRLDFVLRTSSEPGKDLEKFCKVIDKVTTPTLLSLTAHFKNRSEPSKFRAYIPKGKLAKVQFKEGDDRHTIDVAICGQLVSYMETELISRFSELSSLGSVYLDPKLKNYPIPFSQRSATKALNTIARGSKVAFDENTDYIRMFTYWKDGDNRVDVDLSAVALDKDWNFHSQLSYTCLSGVGGIHSGDITSAPNGAAEFIDFDIDKAKAAGIRYVAMNLYSYTQQNFSEFECSAGIMELKGKQKKNQVFDAKTIKNRFDVAGDAKVNIPLVLDLETSQFIWADFALTSQATFNNVEGNSKGVTAMARVAEAITDHKPTLYDLFYLHAAARGADIDEEFDDTKEYNEIFNVDKAREIDDIIANYL